jgi:hypothetical protein
MTVIAIPKILQDRLTDDGARAFVDILDKVENRTQSAVLTVAEERFEKRVATTEAKLEGKIAQTESRLEVKIAQTKTELIGWMFVFWIGQVGAILGILFAFFRH